MKLAKHIDAFSPTFSSFPYSSSFPMYWPSPTTFQPVSLTSVLAESMQEHLVQHSHPAAPGYPDPGCHCNTLYQIQHLPHNRLRCHLEYPSSHSRLANFRYPKCFQVRYPHQFRLDDGRFLWSRGHLIFEFVLQGGPLQTKLVAKVIFPII